MTPCGTVGYTAPEIVKDERYSKSVDMWAMGCVLYTLLCGFPPFYDESIQVLTEKVARGQYTFLSPWWDDISKSAQDLVSHLLTVDPEKRYTIKQFLDHPWIKGTKEPTFAAFDAPPIATPAVERQNQLGAPARAFNADLLESPGGKRSDFRSPGAVNLREVFDVGYAVHRQEEEGKRRKNFKQGYRNDLNEADEDYENDYEDSAVNAPTKVPKDRHADVHQVEQGLKNTNLNAAANSRVAAAPKKEERGYGQHSAAVTAAARQQVRNRKGAFELNLDGATLLGRRGQKGPSGLREAATVPVN
jgi:serine/threonine protein kinase